MSDYLKFTSGQQVKLKDICEKIVDGKHGDCTNEPESGYYFLSAKDIGEGIILYENARQITKDDFLDTHKRTQLEPFDILYTNSGTIGRMAIIKEEPLTQRTTFQKSVAILKPRKSLVQPHFLYYLLRYENKRLAALAGGTAQKNLLLRDFREFPVSIPPIPTQCKIAAILSAYDDLIENNTRRIKILEETAQLVYCEWFVNFRFPGHENINMVNSSLGSIPDGWKTVRTEQIVKRIPAGKLYEQKTVFPSGTVPVLDQGRSGIIGYHNDSPSFIASEEAPVIVFANHTCYQRLIQYPFSAIQNVLPFVPNPDRYRNIYWLHWATKGLVEFNDYKGHWPEFMSKTLLLPSEELCDYFGDTVKPIFKLIYKFERSNINLRETRDLLLPKLISGEIDVSELDIDIGEEAA